MTSTNKDGREPGLSGAAGSTLTFEKHRDITASDCETIAKMLTDLAGEVRKGNMRAFETFWWEGGTEEGDAKIADIRERLLLRYLHRDEHVSNGRDEGRAGGAQSKQSDQ